MESLFLMFLDHTRRRSTVGRTPLDEWSARRRDLSLTTHDTHNRQISMPPVGFEPTISEGERPAAAHRYDISSLRVNQLLYCVSLKIYNKFANYFCELKFSGNTHQRPSSAWRCDTSGNIPPCGVALRRTCICTEFHRVKNANLRHPSAMC